MKQNDKVVKAFFEAFAAHDAGAMVKCYASNATFRDCVFGELKGQNILRMWTYICSKSKDNGFKLQPDDVVVEGNFVRTGWKADYKFENKRPVHNVVTTYIAMSDGKIVNHHDVFDFNDWAHQALGLKALLPGKFLQSAARKEARKKAGI